MSFEDVLFAFGMDVRGIVPPDGMVHRYAMQGKHNKNGWAVKFPDGNAGIYGCWGVTEEEGIFWSADGKEYKELTAERRIEIDKSREIYRKELARRQLQVAEESASMVIGVVGESLYLTRKRVNIHGVGVDADGVVIVPLRDIQGKIWNIQRIYEDGNKLFRFKGRVSGCFHIIEGSDDKTILCEGYATGASIHAATGLRVVVCFDAGNIIKVAKDLLSAKWKNLIVAADNDILKKDTGRIAAEKVKRELGIGYVIPEVPGDFNDLACAGVDISAYFFETIPAFSLGDYLADKTKIPDDIISPRILTPGGMMVFGGAPKVGKSDFILSWLMHMAAGVEFMGMKPPRPLKVFYLQAEIGYHYLRERINMVDIDRHARDVASRNMVITPKLRMVLDGDGVDKVGNTIRKMGGCDIIAIDPLRNLFDGESENDNAEMIAFLINRVEALRHYAGKDAGIVMVHHTKKVAKDDLFQDPFLCFSGASSLRGFYNTGMMMYRPDEEVSERILAYELRDGKPLDNIIVDKLDGRWFKIAKEQSRIAHESQGQKNDNERERKVRVICEQVRLGVESGNFYTRKAMAELLAGRFDLGSSSTIGRLIGEMLAQSELLLSQDGKLIN